MTRHAPRQLYVGMMVGLVLAIIFAGAWAITLLGGAPAYPLRVTGTPEFPAVERSPAAGAPIPVWRGALAVNAHLASASARMPGGQAADPEPLLTAPPGPGAVAVPTSSPASLTAVTAATLGPADARRLDAARAAVAAADWEPGLAFYAELTRRHPGVDALLRERTDALAWAGRHEEAGLLYRELASRAAAEPATLFTAARNLWWSGRVLAADSSLIEYLALVPGDDEAEALLRDVRAAASPNVETARRWAAERPRPLELLAFARALISELHYDEALPVFRRALGAGAADSVWLELASAASAAGASDVAIESLRAWLARHPRDRPNRTALARALTWAQRTDEAIEEFDRLLAAGDDVDLAFERAQLLAWSGREGEATEPLRSIVADRPGEARAHALLGDLAGWRGDWREAVVHHRAAAAAAPDSVELAARLAEAEVALQQARRAAAPPDETVLAAEFFTDRSGFRWAEVSAEQSLRVGLTGFRILGTQTVAARRFGGVQSSSPGMSGRLEVHRPLSDRWTAEVGAGLAQYEAGLFPDLFAAVRFTAHAGIGVGLRVAREPAVRRASSLLALHARTLATRGEITVNGTRGGTSVWAHAGAERFDSDLGSGVRRSAALTARQAIAGPVSAVFAMNATAADGASPMLPGWGAIWWAPERYVQSSAGFALDAARGHWLTSASLLGGYAFVRERAGDRRFDAGRFPTFGTAAELTYRSEAWSVGGALRHGGALDGYRATTLRLQAGYRFR